MERDQLLALIAGLKAGDIPVRASSLNNLDCPWKWLLSVASDREAGEAAQTGTLAHKGIEEWIITGGDLEAAKIAMSALQDEFREKGQIEGRLNAATQWVVAYAKDPCNAPLNESPKDGTYGTVVAVEKPFSTRLMTPAGNRIWIMGKLDQVRVVDKRPPAVYDAKCGLIPNGMLPERWACYHLPQQAMYAVLASEESGVPHGAGGIIHPPAYTGRRGLPVFIDRPLTPEQARVIVDSILTELDRILDGNIVVNPGGACVKCFWAGGPDDCIPMLLAAAKDPVPDAPISVGMLAKMTRIKKSKKK